MLFCFCIIAQGVVNDWRIIAAWPLLMLIDLLLKTPPVARALFDNLAKPETITKVLSGVYVDREAVDEELVDIILQPAFTPNALDVFVSVITGGADAGIRRGPLALRLRGAGVWESVVVCT